MDNKDIDQLAPCPCGKAPTRLIVQPSHAGWATATGNCCHAWLVEFKRNGAWLGLGRCDRLALKAWNNAPRSNRDQENLGAKPGYRLLTDSDTIQRDDEFLEDDCNTWTPVSVGSRAFIGLRHKRGIYQPIRRKQKDPIICKECQ